MSSLASTRTVITLHIVICRDPGCGRAVALCTACGVPRARCCDRTCARRARRVRQRVAGQIYQRGRRGRMMHAMRQQLYRMRRKKVTHHLARISANEIPTWPKAERLSSARRPCRRRELGQQRRNHRGRRARHVDKESTAKARNHSRVAKAFPHSEGSAYKPQAVKSRCTCEWGGWGRQAKKPGTESLERRRAIESNPSL